MKFVKSVQAASVLGGVFAPKDIDLDSQTSIRNVAATLAFETMSYYHGNTTDPKTREFGNVDKPYYWWVAGGLHGAMLDYYHYTSDPSYNDVVLQALLAPTNLGPGKDYMPTEHADEEGNDDLFFWGSAVLSAAERNFPQPNTNLPPWLDISVNIFNQLAGRWDTQHCNGGLFWQVYASNPNGLKYKNSVSNGGFFQLAARLARATANETYLDWADKIWNWNAEVGFIDSQSYRVYDGASIDSGCKNVNKKSFSYTTGIFLYGAAVMAEHTGQDKWKQRTEKLLDEAAQYFFTGKDKNIMWETECEPKGICNYDMITFKGFLSRFMWQTAHLMPSLRAKIEGLLIPTVKAVAAVCTGGKTGHQCGMKWYTAQFDGIATFGGAMCAQEAIQGLLYRDSALPLKAADIKWVKDASFAPIDTYGGSKTSKRDEIPAPSETPSQPGPSANDSNADNNGPVDSEGTVVTKANGMLFALALSISTWCLL